MYIYSLEKILMDISETFSSQREFNDREWQPTYTFCNQFLEFGPHIHIKWFFIKAIYD